MLARYLKAQIIVLLFGGVVGPIFLVTYFLFPGFLGGQFGSIDSSIESSAQDNMSWMLYVGLLITVADVVNSPVIADPLHRLDCCVISDGGGALVVVKPEIAKQLKRPPVKIIGGGETVKHLSGGTFDLTTSGASRTGPIAFAEAGIKPADIKYASIYDSFTITVLMQIEDLGFCGKGEGPAFVRAKGTTFDGDFPNNTSGGQLSVGQAGAAGGFLGMTEAIRQLTDEAGERAVKDAKLGLVTGFGMVTYDRCLCTGAVLLGRSA